MKCFRRYPPDYKTGKQLVGGGEPPEGGHPNKPRTQCVREIDFHAEVQAVRWCTMDPFCAGIPGEG